MVDEAAADGKDLVRDMIGRLKRDILVATNRLDAMRPPDRHAFITINAEIAEHPAAAGRSTTYPHRD